MAAAVDGDVEAVVIGCWSWWPSLSLSEMGCGSSDGGAYLSEFLLLTALGLGVRVAAAAVDDDVEAVVITRAGVMGWFVVVVDVDVDVQLPSGGCHGC